MRQIACWNDWNNFSGIRFLKNSFNSHVWQVLLTCWLLVCTVFQSVPLICLSKKTKWRPSNKEGIKWLIWYQKFLNNLSFALLLYSNKLESCFDVKEDNTQITWMLMTDSLKKWYACGMSAQIGDIPFKGNRLYTRCLVANAIISYRYWTVNIPLKIFPFP